MEINRIEIRIFLLGLGGRGSNIVTHIARLIKTKYNHLQLILCDGDLVEEKNLNRQIGFFHENLGQNKAKVLATQINYMYDINCQYIDHYWNNDTFNKINFNSNDIVITEVDNHATRLLFAQKLENMNFFWIDGANDKESGSTFICRRFQYTKDENLIISRFNYYPSIMNELGVHPDDRSCADHVASGEQDYSVNILGAAIDFSILERYLNGTLLDIYNISYNTHGISSVQFIKDFKTNKAILENSYKRS